MGQLIQLPAIEGIVIDCSYVTTARLINLEMLLGGRADDSFDDSTRIDTELEALSGSGGPVKQGG